MDILQKRSARRADRPKNVKRYLLSRALKLRRRLIAEYRKCYKLAQNGEAAPAEELLVSEFYSVEKHVIETVRSFDEPPKTVLPCISGQPRVVFAAQTAAEAVKNRTAIATAFEAAAEEFDLDHTELDRFHDCLRLILLESLESAVKDGPDATENTHKLLLDLKNAEKAHWDQLVEEISPTVRALKNDPNYMLLDQKSRGICVFAARRIALRLDIPERDVALCAAELASTASDPEQPEAHAAWYLTGAGEDVLVRLLRPDRRRSALKPMASLALFIAVFCSLTAGLSLIFLQWGPGVFAASVFPMATIALSVTTSVFSRLVPPRRIVSLRADRAEGLFASAVAMPVLITSPDSAEEAAKMLENHYNVSRFPGASFILLADLPDAKEQHTALDAAAVDAAKAAITRLNARYGGGFYLLMRDRKRNKDGVFQGYERKRGAVTELLKLLLNGENRFSVCLPEPPPKAKYLAVLDADTVLAPGALKALVGAAAHPANRPVIREGRATSGYSVFAPRMRTTARSASQSLFSRLVSGDVGYELYSPAVSELHMDLYGEGDFGGKGVINVESFLRLTEGRIPDNTVLSHDLLEGSYARAAFVDDVALYDSEPSSLTKWWKRQERWIRGDWQLCPFIFGKYGGGLNAVSKAKMLGNIFRSLRIPVLFVILAASAAANAFPVMTAAVAALIFEPVKAFFELAASSLRERAAADRWLLLVLRTALGFITLPYAAFVSAAAAARSLWRMTVTQRKMLQWQTAASTKEEDGKLKAVNIIAGAVLATVCAALMISFGASRAYLIGIMVSALWILSPAVARTVDRNRSDDRPKADDAEKKTLTGLIGEAWRFFEENCGESTHFLPPDNIQERPSKPAADLTSPTNIGMYLLACIAVRDVGLIDRNEFIGRMTDTLASIDGLEKWRGNLFNWYRVSNTAPLEPRFVSSVDSGNLAAALLVCASALEEDGADASAALCRKLFDETDLSALYDPSERLFYIGYDTAEGRFTPSHYDLYASEARLASFTALIKGDVPVRHWRALSRTMRAASGGRTLVSWSGTAFEYLMPLIFFETVPGSLQHESVLSAVRTQLLCGRPDAPWGTSESGYFRFDRAMNYQYRAFGVPELALEPRRERYEVRAPYASALALLISPKEALSDIERFSAAGMKGRYGFYEALDLDAAKSGSRRVHSFMAHHKGMEICAYAARLTGGKISRRFMADPRVRAFEQLLFESMPTKPIVIKEYESSVYREFKNESKAVFSARRAAPGTIDGALLSNGGYSVHVFSDGTSRSFAGDHTLTDEGGVAVVISDGARSERFVGDAEFLPYKAEFRSEKRGVAAKCTVIAAAERRAEIRVFTLIERENAPKRLRVGFFFRPVLAPVREYEAHPAFVRLTVEADMNDGAVRFRLRPKLGREERVLYAGVVTSAKTEYRSDAFTCPGRLASYESALENPLGGEFSARPIEPLFSAVSEVELAPLEACKLVFIMGLEPSREEACKAFAELRQYHAEQEKLAEASAVSMMRDNGTDIAEAELTEPLAARIAKGVPFKPDPVEIIDNAREKLWRLGVSGDRPIVLVRTSDEADIPDTARFAAFSRYASARGLRFDACVLSSLSTAYADPIRKRLAEIAGNDLTVIDLNDADPEAIKALEGFALISADASAIPYAPAKTTAPELCAHAGCEPLEKRRLTLFNGFGGFDEEKREYVIYAGARPTPAPWSNVIANPSFGTIVTENGGGYTWRKNARLMRITPWSCDPVFDPAGERVFLNESGLRLPLMPYGGGGAYEISHGFGYTASRCSSRGIEAELVQFVDPERPVKYFLVRVRETGGKARRASVSIQIDWAPGEYPKPETVVRRTAGSVTLVRSFAADDGGEYAFLAGGVPDEYGAHTEISVPAHGAASAVFVLGMDKEENVLAYAEELTKPEAAESELNKVRSAWEARLGALTVRTGNAAFDIPVSRLLMYQTLASRIYGRTGFYQSGGAVGFRDRLQDAVALVYADPELTKRILLDSAAHQFPEGDVLHWWHGKGLGVRTRITDDRLFLPYAALEYAEKTGDESVWDEEIPFLCGKELDDAERDRYCEYFPSEETASLFEHCMRAVRRSSGLGPHGLPLMGTGDWNDGMDEVGGESCFNGWLLLFVLRGLIPLCEKRGENGEAEKLSAFAGELRRCLEKTWETDRYLRAIREDGEKLGSRENRECAIDLVTNAWAVFCGAEHAEAAFDTASALLTDEKNAVVRLLDPPFTDTGKNRAGYIEAYVEGARENGGQYTHAGAWAVIAACMLGRAEEAHRLFTMLDPIEHSSAANAERYAVEPYVVAGDVFGFGENAGRGGWTWYTGAAGWLYRAAVEYILGIKKRGRELTVSPCTVFDGFEVDYRFGSSLWRIKAERGGGEPTVDGRKATAIRLADDGKSHEVKVFYK